MSSDASSALNAAGERRRSLRGRWLQALARAVGLPEPPSLRRSSAPYKAQPLAGERVLIGATAAGCLSTLVPALHRSGAQLLVPASQPLLAQLKPLAAAVGAALKTEPNPEDRAALPTALVFDASAIDSVAGLNALYEFFQPRVGRLSRNGRVVVIGRSADARPEAAAVIAALPGFIRSLAKEVGRNGSTANLLLSPDPTSANLEGPLAYLLSPRAAFVSGQTLVVEGHGAAAAAGSALAGRRALVTGAARGIGAAIAQALAREGVQVLGVDHPSQADALAATLAPLGGKPLAVDLASADAPALVAEAALAFGGLDIVVHNAGITRDKLLRNMKPAHWSSVLDVNLGAPLKLDAALLAQQALHEGARIVCVSSIGGIAGNAGQTNYAASKAGLIGYVAAQAPVLQAIGVAINAVAPGFIETQMTRAMPLLPREIGRRFSALAQGGVPEDIAEAVCFLASPHAAGVTGRTLRVCGQNFVGA